MDAYFKQQLRLGGYRGRYDLRAVITSFGGQFTTLERLGTDTWCATGLRERDGINRRAAQWGPTPDIAVAKLWLLIWPGIDRIGN
jgi:hypothetical protein